VNSEQGGVAVTSGGEVIATWSGPVGSSSVVEAAAQLPSNGVWQPTVALTSSTESAGGPVVGIDPAGDATAVWSAQNSSGGVVQSSTLRAGETAWPAATNVSSSAEILDQPQVAVDPQGNAVAAWSSDNVVQAAGYDAAGPLLDAQSIPTSGTVGKPVAFSVSPLDVWSAIASTSWQFGDDQSANGAVTSHTYMSPGKYTVGLSSADTLGNASTAGATITIAAAPAQPPATTPITTTAPTPAGPQLTHVSETHKTWQEGTRHPTMARRPKHQPPVGTRFGFRVNQATRVTFVFTQPVTGRLISHHCQKQTKTNRKRAHCRLTTTPGTLSYSTQPGHHSLSFQGRLSDKRHLPVGAYTLRITATNPTTHRASNTQSLRFTIVKPT
jgi:PKD domain